MSNSLNISTASRGNGGELSMLDDKGTGETPIVENDGGAETGSSQDNGGVVAGDDQATVQSTKTPQTPIDPLTVLETLKLDPTVKEQLKKGYLREADYTKKTQALAEERKLIDEYNNIKPYIDKVYQDPQLYEAVFGKPPPNGEAGDQNTQEDYPEDPREYAEWVKQRTIEAWEAKQAESADIKAAEAVDPRLNTDPEFAKVIGGYVALDADFIEGKKSAEQATRDAIAAHNTYIAKVKADHRTEMNKKVAEKRMVVPQSGTPVSTTGGGKPATMAEAARMAEEELET